MRNEEKIEFLPDDVKKMVTIYCAYLKRPHLRFAVLKLLGLHEDELFKDDF